MIVVHVLQACAKVLSITLPRLLLFSHMDKITNLIKGFFFLATMLIIRSRVMPDVSLVPDNSTLFDNDGYMNK